jgi:hypothetical protein
MDVQTMRTEEERLENLFVIVLAQSPAAEMSSTFASDNIIACA